MISIDLFSPGWFVPSLCEILDTPYTAPRICVWHLATTINQKINKCSKAISKENVYEASEIFKRGVEP